MITIPSIQHLRIWITNESRGLRGSLLTHNAFISINPYPVKIRLSQKLSSVRSGRNTQNAQTEVKLLTWDICILVNILYNFHSIIFEKCQNWKKS